MVEWRRVWYLLHTHHWLERVKTLASTTQDWASYWSGVALTLMVLYPLVHEHVMKLLWLSWTLLPDIYVRLAALLLDFQLSWILIFLKLFPLSKWMKSSNVKKILGVPFCENCDRGFENAAQGCRPTASLWLQYFTIWTNPKLANNMIV